MEKKLKNFTCSTPNIISLAFARTGILYMASENNIEAYTQDGQFVKKWYCPDPHSIAIANDQIVTLCSNGSIYHYNLDGKVLKIWDLYFHNPEAFTIDEDEIFICDTENNRIVVFSIEGILLRQWGIAGTEPGCFHSPAAIAVSENMVYVTDRHNKRIQVFYRNGNYLFEWKFPGTGENIASHNLLVLNSKVYVPTYMGVYVFEVVY